MSTNSDTALIDPQPPSFAHQEPSEAPQEAPLEDLDHRHEDASGLCMLPG